MNNFVLNTWKGTGDSNGESWWHHVVLLTCPSYWPRRSCSSRDLFAFHFSAERKPGCFPQEPVGIFSTVHFCTPRADLPEAVWKCFLKPGLKVHRGKRKQRNKARQRWQVLHFSGFSYWSSHKLLLMLHLAVPRYSNNGNYAVAIPISFRIGTKDGVSTTHMIPAKTAIKVAIPCCDWESQYIFSTPLYIHY